MIVCIFDTVWKQDKGASVKMYWDTIVLMWKVMFLQKKEEKTSCGDVF